MRSPCFRFLGRNGLGKKLLTVVAIFAGLSIPIANAVTINVVGWDRVNKVEVPVTGFSWVLEEDNSAPVTPGASGATDTLALQFHASHSPVLADGNATTSSANIPLTGGLTGRYFISVLPHQMPASLVDPTTGAVAGTASVFSMSGVSLNQTQDAATIKIVVNANDIPTAQISVLAYEDHFPLNNMPDRPAAAGPGTAGFETGLANFDVLLFDGGGLYGQAGGQVIQDAFGNPLGTVYNPNGSVTPGNGILKTGADGTLLIKNLVPGKYGIQMVPPPGSDWQQTHTIEGSLTVDAWVKPNEPSYFMEFGPPGHHVFTGFVSPSRLDNAARAGSSTLTGRVTHMHMSRPPLYAFYLGNEVSDCWVGLNPLPLRSSEAVYAGPCNPDGTFEIPGLRAGLSYQLVIWDEAKFNVIANQNISIPATGGDLALGDVGVFDWFARTFATVFTDLPDPLTGKPNGFMDVGEKGMLEQNTNIRFRNGTIYRALPTDFLGEAPQVETFPFFHWLVAEVDFARYKATGITYVVDDGGVVEPDNGWTNPTFDMSKPQPQDVVNPNTGNNLSRTMTSADEGGPVLTMAFQAFLGQTNHLYWGKVPYARGENGGISGIVYYATTRAEEKPQFAAAEEWEPGVPRVQVNLYKDGSRNPFVAPDGIIDDLNGNGTLDYADVDNYPLGWSDGTGVKGGEDVDHNGDGVFDLGDALQITHTDSWDDSNPTGCQGPLYEYPVGSGITHDCYDGLRNFNQVRPGVFDGGYAFAGADNDPALAGGLPAGDYIVEAATPPGYVLLKEEDKNVDFGEILKPAPDLLPAACVGEPRIVPPYRSMQTHDDGNGVQVPHVPAGDLIASPFAGEVRPLCDRKQIRLTDGTNAAVDFYVFTNVPRASRVVGFMLNDLANEFDPNAPNFGEKLAPSWLPVSIKDWTGREILRTYSDQWGKYNALLPSTYTMNAPMPSGVGPNMLTACMNDAGQQFNAATGQYETDPYFNRQFTQFCYTFQFMPGTTTYLDTPVLPIAAFATNGDNPVDCECLNKTPKIYSVNGPVANSGPVVSTAGGVVTILSQGATEVPNPAFTATGTAPKTISRDYGFGGVIGTVVLESTGQDAPIDLPVATWGPDSITVNVPAGIPTGQLMITRGDNGKKTESGITLYADDGNPSIPNFIYVVPSNDPLATPIQAAINAASTRPGDVIMISPGIYNEMVILDKAVSLQGFGAGSVSINPYKVPAEKLNNWRNDIVAKWDNGAGFTLLPGQLDAAGGLLNRVDNEPGLFPASEGPGIVVLGKDGGGGQAIFNRNRAVRIDGMTISGGDTGGAIFVNGYAHFLNISNMRIVANQGTYGGGVRVGDPWAPDQLVNNPYNNRVAIHHNEILENGGQFGGGGGVAIYTGSRNYQVSNNRICGNFSQAGGGGIGHVGVSDGGKIVDNTIIFNQSFDQLLNVHGGGVLVSGTPTVAGLTNGSGDVTISGNLIQGNNAGAGDGAGIRAQFVNGTEVGRNANRWYGVDITDNIIVNNVAGYAGGGISLSDVLKSNIINNTIANNDSTGTTESALAENPSPNASLAHTAGIVSYAHSLALNLAIPNQAGLNRYRGFANPTLRNNIVWQNRSFNWSITPATVVGGADTFGLNEQGYEDLGVLPVGIGSLEPFYNVLTDTTGYDSTNTMADPALVTPYHNGSRGQTLIVPEFTTSIRTAAALDEGGNSIDVAYGPLTLDGGTAVVGSAEDGIPDSNYHIGATSSAIDAGWPATDVEGDYRYTDIVIRGLGSNEIIPSLVQDLDGDCRNNENSFRIDIGADEVTAGACP